MNKFKLWHKFKKRFLNSYYNKRKKQKIYYVVDNNKVLNIIYDLTKKKLFIYDVTDKIVIAPFLTFDDLGNEIYYGDIVKFNYKDDNLENLKCDFGIVFYDENLGQAKIIAKNRDIFRFDEIEKCEVVDTYLKEEEGNKWIFLY